MYKKCQTSKFRKFEKIEIFKISFSKICHIANTLAKILKFLARSALLKSFQKN